MNRILSILLFITIIHTSCNQSPKNLTSENGTINKSNLDLSMDVSLFDMISLLDNIENDSLIKTKIDSLKFDKKFNGIYVSKEKETLKKPKHWIHITNMGSISTVSYSTVDKNQWQAILNQTGISEPISFDDGTSDISNKYSFGKYRIESYEPRDGVNVDLNNLYQVYVLLGSK